MPTQTGSIDLRGIKQSYESVEVGGRNLIILTNMGLTNILTSKGGGSYSTEAITIEDGRKGFRMYNISGITGWLVLNIPSYVAKEKLVALPSTAFSYSLDIRTDGAGSVVASYRNGDATKPLIAFPSVNISSGDSGKWVHISGTSTSVSTPENSSQSFYIDLRNIAIQGGATYIEIKNVKFEQGNKPTVWSPAPEDALDKSISIYTRTNSSTTPTALPTVIVTNTADTGTTAPATNGNGWTKRQMSRVYASNLAYKYLWTCNQLISVGGYLLGHTDVVADEGTVYLNGGDVVAGTVSADQLAANAVTADKIAANAIVVDKMDSTTQSQVLNSNIEVGGKNLLDNTKTWSGHIGTATLLTDTYRGCSVISRTVPTSTTDSGVWNGLTFVEADSDYTLSFWAKADTAGTKTISHFYPELVATVETSTGYNGTSADGYCQTTLTTSWERYWIKWHTKASISGNKNLIVCRCNTSTASKIYLAGAKLEKGNKATDWTPAPEDLQADIDAKKSIHTFSTSYSYTYSTILGYAAEGYFGSWNIGASVITSSGVKVGDTARLKVIASDMGSSGTPVYVVGTVEQIEQNTGYIAIRSHGLDTTVIDGGHILTGTIDANNVNISNLTVGSFTEETQSNIPWESDVENEPYSFRKSGNEITHDFSAKEEKIIGCSIAWNQQAPEIKSGNYDLSGATNPVWGTNQITFTASGNQARITSITGKSELSYFPNHVYFVDLYAAASTARTFQFQLYTGNSQYCLKNMGTTGTTWTSLSTVVKPATGTAGNKWAAYAFLDSAANDTCSIKDIVVVDLTLALGSTIADYIYTLESGTAGAGVAWIRKLFNKPYYDYDTGTLKSVSGLISHNTTGFNQLSDVTPVASSSAWGVVLFGKANLLPNTTYCISFVGATGNTFYTNEFLFTTQARTTCTGSRQYVVITTKSKLSKNETTQYDVNRGWMLFKNDGGNTVTAGFKDVCMNFDDAYRNGEYEPYIKHSYPLDSSLALRGMFKLDANNNLYADGDIYPPSGEVQRKWGFKDSNFARGALDSQNVLYAVGKIPVSIWVDGENGISNLFPVVNLGTCRYNAANGIKSMSIFGDTVYVGGYVGSESALDALLPSLEVLYTLPTPTTESAQPFQSPQAVSNRGTEEYVTTGIVPVGHETIYMNDAQAGASVEAADTAKSFSDEAAKTATTYITDIDTNHGITVKPADSSGNDYLQMNSTDIRFVRNNTDVMNLTDSSFRIGTASGKHTTTDSNGLHVWTGAESTAANEVAVFGSTARIGTASGARVETTSTGLDIYNSSNQKKASYGSTQYIYGGSGTYPLTEVSSTAVKIAQASNTYAQVNSDGLDVTKGGTSIANFGATARIGTASGARAETTSTGLDIYNSSNQKKASYGSTQYIYGGSGTYPLAEVSSSAVKMMQSANNYAQVDSDGLKVYKGGSADSNIVASFGDSVRIGKEAYGHVSIDSDGLYVKANDDGSTVSGSTDVSYITSNGIHVGNDVTRIFSSHNPDVYSGDGANTSWFECHSSNGISSVVYAQTGIHAIADTLDKEGSVTVHANDDTGDTYTIISGDDLYIESNTSISGSLTLGGHDSSVGSTLSNSASKAIGTANINTYTVGPKITLTPGAWIVRATWQYNSVTGARVIDIDIATDNSTSASTTTLWARQRVANNTGAWSRLEVYCMPVVTTSTDVYVKGSATVTSTAQSCSIQAMRIA